MLAESARYRRQAERAGQVREALAEASEWFGRAQLAPPDDLAPWQRADAAAERVRGLLTAGDVDPQAAAQAGRILVALEEAKGQAEARAAQRERDRRMLARLDEIRLIQDVGPRTFDYARAVAEYDRAFRDYEIDPDRPTDSAPRLADSPIRAALLLALDDWIDRHTDAKARGRLLALAKAAEPEPDGWAAKLRDARVRRDGAALKALAEAGVPDAPAAALAGWGRALARAGEWVAAEDLLREAWRRHPGDFWVAYELAECLRSAPRPKTEESLRFYTAAVALNPASPGLRNNFGTALTDAKRPAEAEAEFRAAIKAKPDYAIAYSNLGNALTNRDRLDDAVAAYREALRRDPALSTAHNNLGNALKKQGKLADAEAAYRAAIQVRPTYAVAHSNLGNALLDLGRREEAEAAYRTAIRHDPDYALAHNGLGILLARQRRFAEAEAAFRESVRSDPDFAAGYHGLGTALLSLGRPAEAEAELREAVRLDPELTLARFKLGGAFHRQKRLSEAEATFREVLRKNEDYTDAALALATVVSEQGRLDEAEAALRGLVGRRPDHAPVRVHLGELLAKKGQLDAAAAEYREAIRLKPDLYVAHNNLGIVLRRQGRFAQSLAVLRRAAELAPEGYGRSTQRQVQEAQRLAGLDAKLAAVLRGAAPPADGAGRAELADFALRHTDRPDAAARLYREAFTADPELAGDLTTQHRYNAACAAVRTAAAGPPADRAAWRRQALDWLTADLARWADPARKPGKRSPSQVLKHWQGDPDLAGVRDEAALAALHGLERAAWRKLWADVEAARRAAGR
jgi:tetratricopeptide (TPR) repeat protein